MYQKKRPTQKRGHVGNPMPHKLSFNPTHQNSDGNDFGDGLWHWVYRVYHHWWFSKALEDLGRPRACLFLGGLKQQNLSRDKPLGSLWYTQNDWFDETWYNPDEEKQDTFIYIYIIIYIYIQCNGCKLMAATVVWRYRPRCLEHNFPKSTEKGNHGSFIRKLMADGNL